MMIAWIVGVALAGSDVPHGMPPVTNHVGDHGKARLPARDGTELFTRWYVPNGDGPWPTVVTRVPYPMDAALDWQCRVLVRRGYACVFQHVRGRGRSDGTWTPFVNEERDGQDLIAWVKTQEWSDGRVAWVGDSYLAATGWTVASDDPDGVSTLVSRIFAPSLYTSAYEDGLLRHELVTAWMAIMPDERAGLLASRRYHRALETRPRTDMDVVASGHEIGWYDEWLSAEDPAAPLWTTGDPQRFAKAAASMQLPVLMVGGWSDAFIEAQVDAWADLPDEVRAESVLVVGPWAHLGQSPSAVPLRNQRGSGGVAGYPAFQTPRVIDWLDVHVKGEPAEYPTQGVITYVVGGDRWETRADWPPPTQDLRFEAVGTDDPCEGELSRGGGLETRGGGLPARRELTFPYDPEDPLKSRGGAGMLAGAVPLMKGVKPGFVRAPDHCERREDVLRFESPPLDAPLHLAGTLRVEMEVSSDAADTAFGFRLLERRKNGAEFLLREGFTTLALRDGAPRKPYTPGERVTVVPDAAPLEAEIHEGSQLVLVLTSSSFPSYEAHPNVAGNLSDAKETVVAQQTVYSATLVVPQVAP
jgi:putative CocE/NonD family hydrolase